MNCVNSLYSQLTSPNKTSLSSPYMTNLQNWYEADSGVVESSSKVSQWTDKSVNGRNATQSNASYKPTYSATGLNGKPTIIFDGTTNGIMMNFTGGGSALTEWTACFVLYQVIKTTLLQELLMTSGTWATGKIAFQTQINARNVLIHLNPTDPTVSGYSWTDNTPYLYIVTGKASGGVTTMRYYINGVTYNTATSSTSTTNFGSVNMGGWDQDLTRTLNGGISAILLYSSELTTDQRLQTQSYLASKWGISI